VLGGLLQYAAAPAIPGVVLLALAICASYHFAAASPAWRLKIPPWGANASRISTAVLIPSCALLFFQYYAAAALLAASALLSSTALIRPDLLLFRGRP
jgi:hypothetical protein